MDKDWHNCYRQGWGQDLIPAAYAHPAKVARGLTRRIYAYAVERGWLKIGDTCLDPFAGISGFALDAMFHGLHWIGVELEDKFVQLGQQNIDLWNCRYGNGKLPRWGTAVILQGDSRNLVEVLEGARAEGIIASPPFSNSQQVDNRTAPVLIEGSSWKKRQGSITVGTDPAQLGNMPTGEPPADYTHTPGSLTPTQFDAKAVTESMTFTTAPKREEAVECEWEEKGVDGIIASPPYAQAKAHPSIGSVNKDDWGHDGRNIVARRGLDADYGNVDGQLAALPEGEPPREIAIDAIMAAIAGKTPTETKALCKEWRKRGGKWAILADMIREGEPPAGIVQVDACVSSPPWEQSGSAYGSDGDAEFAEEWQRRHGKRIRGGPAWHNGKSYGNHPDQLGNQQGDTFWSAARAILLQCHQVLAPGGKSVPDIEGIEFCDC